MTDFYDDHEFTEDMADHDEAAAEDAAQDRIDHTPAAIWETYELPDSERLYHLGYGQDRWFRVDSVQAVDLLFGPGYRVALREVPGPTQPDPWTYPEGA